METPRKTILLFWAIALPVAATAAHGPLLPRPQKVSYGKGALPLAGLFEQGYEAGERSEALVVRLFDNAPGGAPAPRGPRRSNGETAKNSICAGCAIERAPQRASGLP